MSSKIGQLPLSLVEIAPPPAPMEEVSDSIRTMQRMDDVAICVSNVSKCYHIYNQPQDRLKQSILPRLQRLIGQPPKSYAREFWALKDVSFEIKKGETVGIIGRNGSGKSTLLQMICGTLTPTSGTIETRGRVAALLELGAGFNPEFTGRENVYMNGAVLGLSREEIDARFDDIAAFADIGDFIEQPVKTYSSGMYVRLAFAVQVCVVPDILIVDEALSVGDFVFTLKCLKRIENLKMNGTSILFVTHDITLVQKLCDRVLYLHQGVMKGVGDPAYWCSRYIRSMTEGQENRAEGNMDQESTTSPTRNFVDNDWPSASDEAAFSRTLKGQRTGNHDAEITLVALRTAEDGCIARFGEIMMVEVFLRVRRPIDYLCISMYVIDDAGQLLLGTNTNYEGTIFPRVQPPDRIKIRFSFENRLRAGEYGVTVIVSNFIDHSNNGYIDYIEPAALFRVVGPARKTRWAIYSPRFDLRSTVNGNALDV